MPKTNVILIDYENVQPNLDVLQSVSIENIKIYIFIGQNQKKLPVDLVSNMLKYKGEIKLIEIEGSGRNALDLHIAYYLGQLSKEDKNYCFHIISKDTDYDILIKYLEKKNINCSREAEIKDAQVFVIPQETNICKENSIKDSNKPKKENGSIKVEIKDIKIFTLQQKANSYKEKFVKSPNKPKKKKTLIAAIKAFFTKEAITEKEATYIIDLLKKEKILSIDNTGKVSYKT